MFLTLFIAINLINITSTECVAKCKTVKMSEVVVPTVFKQCRCVFLSNNETIKTSKTYECIPHYRSLKFRDKKSGTVILHKAVVEMCSGLDYQEYVDQNKFHHEEIAFLLQKFHIPCAKSNINFRIHNVGAKSNHQTMHDEFRSTIMQLYRKPDGHLRFG